MEQFPFGPGQMLVRLLQVDRAASAGTKQQAPAPHPPPGLCQELPESPRVLLTVRVALAELLTEILSHDAGAGAVTGMLGVVTGLVVVHLGR